MTEPSTFQQPVVLRERSGWGAPVGLGLFVALFSTPQSGLMLLIPLALLLIAAPPRRPLFVLLGGVLLVLGLSGPSTDVLWWFSRGWALMLGALFLVMTVLRPQSAFLDRALGTVLGTAVTTAVLLLVRSGWSALDASVTHKLRESVSAAEAQLGPAFAARNWGTESLQAMYKLADYQSMVYPALLALTSLAALGVAWWLWRRMTVRDANPLASLPEFRFRDELVWLVVVAVLLLLLPLGDFATRAGANLAMFMGVMYALRGLAVIFALFAPGPLVVAAGIVSMVFLLPVMVATTVVLGLTDTWMDLRSRPGPTVPRPPK